MTKSGSSLLIDDYPIVASPKLAIFFGNLNKAVILQQIHYWLEKSENIYDGKKWVYNSIKNWTITNFAWLSESTVKNLLGELEDDGYIITANYNKRKFDRTKWYSIDYDKLNNSIEEKFSNESGKNSSTISQNLPNESGKNSSTISQNLPNESGNNYQTNTRDYTETTNRDYTDIKIMSDSDESNQHALENQTGIESTKTDSTNGDVHKSKLEIEFEEVWKKYPRKEAKEPAKKSFIKWRKKGDTLEEIISGVERYKQSKDVQNGFVQKGSRFFNQRGWKDEYSNSSPGELVSGEILKGDIF